MIEQRPWGYFQNLEKTENYLVKKIVVNAGQSLSLQYHNHREEHWIIVEGSPLLTIDKDVKTYFAGQSVFVPKKCVHRVQNTSNRLIVIIEIQIGDILSETDIVRLEDVYDRK